MGTQNTEQLVVKKKSHKLTWALFIIVLALAGAVTYFGLMPGLRTAFF